MAFLTAVDISEEIGRLDKKSQQLAKDIYSNLTPGKSLLRRFSVYCLPSIRARARGGWALLCAAPRKTGLAAFRCSWRGCGVWRLRWAGSLPERAKVCGRRHSMGLAIAGTGRTLAKCPKKSMTCGLAC